ncbi:MAG: hypothetical protein ACOX5G_10350 [Kiritimatiellia bacterium]|jgi:chromosome segregation ATPase
MKRTFVLLAACALALSLSAGETAAPATAEAPSAEAAQAPAPADEAAGLRAERATVLASLRESGAKTTKARQEAERTNPELAAKVEEIQKLEAAVSAARKEYRAIAESLPQIKAIREADQASYARLREIDERLREIDPSSVPPRRTDPPPKAPRTFERPRPSAKAKAAE